MSLKGCRSCIILGPTEVQPYTYTTRSASSGHGEDIMNQSLVRGSSFSLTSRFTSATASVIMLVMAIKSVRQVSRPGGKAKQVPQVLVVSSPAYRRARAEVIHWLAQRSTTSWSCPLLLLPAELPAPALHLRRLYSAWTSPDSKVAIWC